MPDLVQHGNWWWPASDKWGHKVIPEEVGPATSWLKAHNTRWGSIIQAGANTGTYADQLCDMFEHVVSAEPDTENFQCCMKNVGHRLIGPLWVYQAALGDEDNASCRVIEHDPQNCGAYRTEAGEGVRVRTIDSICAQRRVEPDVIWLDIEGSELQALRGATEALKRCKPIVIVELKGLGHSYGYDDSDVGDFLARFGYAPKSTHGNDTMFTT